MSYTDKTFVCRDCGQDFVFTGGEQEFFAQQGFEHPPSRCSDCRATRKSQRGGISGASPGTGFGRREREMFSAICSACGQSAQVPFQPRGDKPVYCSDCFARERGATRSYR